MIKSMIILHVNMLNDYKKKMKRDDLIIQTTLQLLFLNTEVSE